LGKNKGNIKKKKLGKFSSLTVVISLSLSLSLIGILGSLLLHAKKLSDYIKNNIELHVYLDPDINQVNVKRLETLFSIKPYVKNIDDKAQISYVSQEEAVKRFIVETGEDFTELLDVNPIGSSFILKISDEFSSSFQLNKLKTEIQEMQGVFQVDFREDLVDDINSNIQVITVVLLIFASLLVLAVTILMNNTIRLALFSQRFLIRSMQLVGATDAFIRKPFILRGALQGLFSGTVASFVVVALLNYAYMKVTSLKLLEDNQMLFSLLAFLIVFGIVIGFFSSLNSVKKYLRSSLDELHN